MEEILKRALLIAFFVVCLNLTSHAQEKIEISLKRGSQGEAQTKAQLERLLKFYDLSKWIFTRSVVIDEKSIPHSHPILTLHTRHLKDDELLLSTFVHEQIHWFLAQKNEE